MGWELLAWSSDTRLDDVWRGDGVGIEFVELGSLMRKKKHKTEPDNSIQLCVLLSALATWLS
jgi:hypothetical protein